MNPFKSMWSIDDELISTSIEEVTIIDIICKREIKKYKKTHSSGVEFYEVSRDITTPSIADLYEFMSDIEELELPHDEIEELIQQAKNCGFFKIEGKPEEYDGWRILRINQHGRPPSWSRVVYLSRI